MIKKNFNLIKKVRGDHKGYLIFWKEVGTSKIKYHHNLKVQNSPSFKKSFESLLCDNNEQGLLKSAKVG